jgi:hypothetical protein
MFDVRQLGEAHWHEGRPSVIRNAPWLVQVEKPGLYQIELRRWPEECGAPISAGLPEHKAVDGVFPEGIALPITKARLRIGDIDLSKPVKAEDSFVAFEVDLAPGKEKLLTSFLGSAGEEICGAFYVTTERR